METLSFAAVINANKDSRRKYYSYDNERVISYYLNSCTYCSRVSVCSIGNYHVSSNYQCNGGETPFRLDLMTDRFPSQTTWQVTDFVNETVLNGGPYNEIFKTYEEAYCLNKAGCYQFTILDSASDGICCDWFNGNGRYELYFDSIFLSRRVVTILAKKTPLF